MDLQAWWQTLSPNEKAAFIGYPGLLLTLSVSVCIAIYNKRPASAASASKSVVSDPLPSPASSAPPEQIPAKVDAPSLQAPLPVTVEDICESIRAATPFNQRAVGESYCGLMVSWVLKIWIMHFRDDLVEIVFIQEKEVFGSYEARCTVSIVEYPELKVAREGDIYRVTGKIDRASRHEVHLSAAVLKRAVRKAPVRLS